MQVLISQTIVCRKVWISGNVPDTFQPRQHIAIHVLLKQGHRPSCSFRGIRTLFLVNAHPLLCLLPPNIVSVLPDLEELYFKCAHNQYADLQPLPYCSSLRKLSIEGPLCGLQQLPRKYHTAEDLQRQLPSITSLTSRVDMASSNDDLDIMLYAWRDKLTELKMGTPQQPSNLLHCTHLKSLTWIEYNLQVPLRPLPSSLASLQLTRCIRESDLETILQLPESYVLSFIGFEKSLQRTWSHRLCTWQQLTIKKMNMVDLGKLPFQSLKGENCLNIETLVLPDPELPHSLPDVIHAAECVSAAGIRVEGFQDWVYKHTRGVFVRREVDEATAQLLSTASKIVQNTTYKSQYIQLSDDDILAYPRTTAALISSYCQSIETVSMSAIPQAVPWLWQALQSCSRLQMVYLYGHKPMHNSVYNIIRHVQTAVDHLVAVTQKPVRFEIYLNTAICCEYVADELFMDLQEKLPSSVVPDRCY